MKGTERSGVLRRLAVVVLRTPRYAQLAANLARDDRLTGSQRARAAASLGYALSPIDLVPGLIPVVGQLDDLAVLIGGLRGVLRLCPPEVARDHLQRTNLALATMDEDLAAVGATARWVARGAGNLLRKAASASARAVVRAVVSRVHRDRPASVAGRAPDPPAGPTERT